MNQVPDVFRYKWPDGSKIFQEHFVSKSMSPFQSRFDELPPQSEELLV